jgi:hypothetical protein
LRSERSGQQRRGQEQGDPSRLFQACHRRTSLTEAFQRSTYGPMKLQMR